VGPAGDSDQAEKTSLPRSWWWFCLVVVLYAAFIAVSVHVGVPKKLPGVALGSPALLYIERASVALVAVAAVFILAAATRLGRLPSRPRSAGTAATAKRGVQYDQEIARRAGQNGEKAAARLVALENGARASAEAIALTEPVLSAHSQRLAALESARKKRRKPLSTAIKPELTRIEQLRSLIAGEQAEAQLWKGPSPALRAQAAASIAVLEELAQRPPTATARPGRGVDVLVLGPDSDWATGVLLRLREALPDWPAGELATWRREAVQPGVPGSIMRVTVDVPERDGQLPVERIRAATTGIEGVEVDYSEPLDLIVVTPRVDADPSPRA